MLQEIIMHWTSGKTFPQHTNIPRQPEKKHTSSLFIFLASFISFCHRGDRVQLMSFVLSYKETALSDKSLSTVQSCKFTKQHDFLKHNYTFRNSVSYTAHDFSLSAPVNLQGRQVAKFSCNIPYLFCLPPPALWVFMGDFQMPALPGDDWPAIRL